MFILKELYVVSPKKKEKKKEKEKRTLCMESYACDTVWVQTIIPLNLNVGIHVYGLVVAIVVGSNGFKKH